MPELSLALLAIVPLALVELAKSARWRVLFGPQRPSYKVCLQALVAGQLTNALSPLRAGEVVRLGLVAARGAPIVTATAALAGAKAIDTLILGVIAIAVVGTSALKHPGWGLLAGAVIALLGICVSIFGAGLKARLEAHPLSRKLRLASLVDVAQTLHDWRSLGIVVATTAVVWSCGLAANGIILASVGITPSLSLMARVLIAGYLIGLVPAPPARLGVFETGIAVALSSAGVPLQQALVVAVALHACQLAELALLVGVGFLIRRGWWSSHSAAHAEPVTPSGVGLP